MENCCVWKSSFLCQYIFISTDIIFFRIRFKFIFFIFCIHFFFRRLIYLFFLFFTTFLSCFPFSLPFSIFLLFLLFPCISILISWSFLEGFNLSTKFLFLIFQFGGSHNLIELIQLLLFFSIIIFINQILTSSSIYSFFVL